MFFYFNQNNNNNDNSDELLLNIFKEKGVVKIIQDYRNDLETIADKISYDEFEIKKSQKTLNNIKSKIKEGLFIRFRNHTAREPDFSCNTDLSISANSHSVNHWENRIRLYQDTLKDTRQYYKTCKNRYKVRLQCHECWYDVAKQWRQLARDYLEISKIIGERLQFYQRKYILINRVLGQQRMENTLHSFF